MEWDPTSTRDMTPRDTMEYLVRYFVHRLRSDGLDCRLQPKFRVTAAMSACMDHGRLYSMAAPCYAVALKKFQAAPASDAGRRPGRRP